jgi:hypothetical protein
MFYKTKECPREDPCKELAQATFQSQRVINIKAALITGCHILKVTLTSHPSCSIDLGRITLIYWAKYQAAVRMKRLQYPVFSQAFCFS